MQNLVILMEPSDGWYADRRNIEAGKMVLNRFCIEEDAAFDLSGVYYLEKTWDFGSDSYNKSKAKSKGKGYSLRLPKCYYLKPIIL